MDQNEKPTENSPETSENQPSASMAVSGVVVLIALEDGSLRQAHISEVAHMRTILNICTMNEKKGLMLGSTDFAPLLNEHITPEEDNDTDGMPEETA